MTPPLLIHGVIPADAPEPAGAPAGRRLGFLAPDGRALAGLVSPLGADEGAAADAAEALRHHDILAAHAALGDVAPARFGAAAQDEAAALACLCAHGAEWAEALDRIAGCVEWGARLTLAEAAAASPPVTDGGRDYLRARLEARRARETAEAIRTGAIAAIQHRLAESAKATVAHLPSHHAPGPRRILELALLAPRAAAEALTAAAEAAAREAARAGLALALSGPWPAYSFAAGPDGGAA